MLPLQGIRGVYTSYTHTVSDLSKVFLRSLYQGIPRIQGFMGTQGITGVYKNVEGTPLRNSQFAWTHANMHICRARGMVEALDVVGFRVSIIIFTLGYVEP